MTTQARIQKHVNHGFSVVARQAGDRAAWYRPIGTSGLLTPAVQRGTVPLYADSNPNLEADAPSKFGAPTIFGAYDVGLGVKVGDYLVDPTWGTVFVASQQTFRPALFVRCSATVTLYREMAGTSYGGATSVAIATDWQVGLTVGRGRASAAPLRLPDDPRLAGAMAMLPVTFPAQPRPGDRFYDQQPISIGYLVEGADLSAEGWMVTLSTRAP